MSLILNVLRIPDTVSGSMSRKIDKLRGRLSAIPLTAGPGVASEP
jgi:hypothetical protein